MAAVLSIASAKGGCSKTTLTVGIGVELALDGYIVVVLDADLNQHATKFGEKAKRGSYGLPVDLSNIAEDSPNLIRPTA